MRYFAALCAIKRTTSLAPSLRSRLRYLRRCGVNLAPHGTRCGMKYLSHTIIELLRYHIQWKSAFKMECCKRYRPYLGPRREKGCELGRSRAIQRARLGIESQYKLRRGKRRRHSNNLQLKLLPFTATVFLSCTSPDLSLPAHRRISSCFDSFFSDADVNKLSFEVNGR